MRITKKSTLTLAGMLLASVTYADSSRMTRAAWIAAGDMTVTGRKDDDRQSHVNAVLDRLVDRGINSVFIMLPDTMSYAEPWIEGCRQRGLEYIAHVTTLRLNGSHGLQTVYDAAVSPGLIVRDGDVSYLDPGHPATADCLTDMYRDMIYDYDFDGYLFDNLYYPSADFDDSATRIRYKPDGFDTKQWRRDNLTECADRLSQMVRMVKPAAKIYLTVPDMCRAGADCGYDTGYDCGQDAVTWAVDGYVDVIVPESFQHTCGDFDTSLHSWISALDGHAALLPVLSLKSSDRYRLMDDIESVLSAPRDIVCGMSFDNISHLTDSDVTYMLDIAFPDHAHLPYNPLGDTDAPQPPSDLTQEYAAGAYRLSWRPADETVNDVPVRYYTIYDVSDRQPREIVHATTETAVTIPCGIQDRKYAVTVTNRNNRCSEPVEFRDTDLRDFDFELWMQGDVAYIRSATTIRQIDVHTLTGHTVTGFKVNDTQTQVDLNNLIQGVYVLRILRDNRSAKLYKVVI